MKHTFLFRRGKWTGTGTYFDENNNSCPVEGETTIIHEGEIWKNQGYIKLLIEHPVLFKNNYEIIPFKSDEDFTTWTSTNPDIGKLIGKFVIIDDTIISSYHSENLEYNGGEILVKIDDETYKSRGYLFKEDKKVSSHAVELKKVE